MKKKEIKVGTKVYVDGYTSMAQQNAHEAKVEELKPQFDKDTGERFEICRVGDVWYKVSDGSCYSNSDSMYFIEFIHEELNINLNTINGNEIIDFLNKLSNDNYVLEDMNIDRGTFKFIEQSIYKNIYNLDFSVDYNNWGEGQELSGNSIQVTKEGIHVFLDEPLEDCGAEEFIEKQLEQWLKNHKFKSNSEDEWKYILQEAYDKLSQIDFKDVKAMDEIINMLIKAKTYMKTW
jgi:hypothetical protein